MELGYKELHKKGLQQRGIGQYRMMVVTDGEVQNRSDDLDEKTIQSMRQRVNQGVKVPNRPVKSLNISQ